MSQEPSSPSLRPRPDILQTGCQRSNEPKTIGLFRQAEANVMMTVSYQPDHWQGMGACFGIWCLGTVLLLAGCSPTAPSTVSVRLASPPPPPVLTSPKDGARVRQGEAIICEFVMKRPSGDEFKGVGLSPMVILSLKSGNTVVAERMVPFKGYTSYRVELDGVNRVGKYTVQVKVINYIKLNEPKFNTADPTITFSSKNSIYVARGAGK